jgi:diaminohydroxyphosphoribosylaminopyrimidine deaminase/5-amino-6-(5-phosphoribosylamino)uracil reductase
MTNNLAEVEPLDALGAWLVVRELGRLARSGRPLATRTWFTHRGDETAVQAPAESGSLWVDPTAEPCFGARAALAPEAASLLRLYLPLCFGAHARELVIAHLGQSLDGQIATSTGASRYVTSAENLTHLHRLRALCDAVVVGASTIACDDPKLTTRLVAGENAARVVIDPALRTVSAGLWRDRAARTLLVCADGSRAALRLPDEVEVVQVPLRAERLDPASIVVELQKRGLQRLLVEGGGITVSRFLEARAAHRLHLCVSPVLLGRGRPGLALPPIDSLADALRPRTRRFELGGDVLFDCELEYASPR